MSNYSRATTLSNAVSSLASTGLSLTKVDEREKQAALEEEQARLKALKVSVCILFFFGKTNTGVHKIIRTSIETDSI